MSVFLISFRYELDQYQPGLADRPSLLLGNKIDVPGAQEKLEELKARLSEHKSSTATTDENVVHNLPVMGVSAKKLLGIDELLHYLRVIYDTHSANAVHHQEDPTENTFADR